MALLRQCLMEVCVRGDGAPRATVANRLPGPGTVYLGQQLKFRAPMRPGDTVRATVTVLSVDEARGRAVLSTVCCVGDGVVVEGKATVMTTPPARRAARLASVLPA